jgi:nicotinic acid mononucleotide adenylyltransferase
LSQGVLWLPAELHDVSSTMVRAAVNDGKDVTEFVPVAVAKFIKDHKMYKK